MNDTAGLFDRVRRILMSDWDPIGIQDAPQARDEYDDYARQITRRLADGASTTDVSSHLLEIETNTLGLPGNRRRAAAVARKLWQIANA